MTTNQASKPSGTVELLVTVLRKMECHVDRDSGRNVSSLYRAGYAISALLDAGVR